MKITTLAKVKPLLKSGYRRSRFDRGKYKWTGTCNDYINLEVPDYPGIIAVYAERRSDKHGPYVALIAVHK